MDFTALQTLLTSLAALQQQVADAQALVDAAKKAGYDEGFAAGVASVPPAPASDKIYSQADVDAMVQPLQAQITDLQSKVDGMPAAIDAAIAQFKADALAKLKAEEATLESIFA